MISRRVRGPGGIVRWEPLEPARKPGRPRSAKCGTNSGYHRHWHDNEPSCTACLEAHRIYTRERIAARANQEVSA